MELDEVDAWELLGYGTSGLHFPVDEETDVADELEPPSKKFKASYLKGHMQGTVGGCRQGSSNGREMSTRSQAASGASRPAPSGATAGGLARNILERIRASNDKAKRAAQATNAWNCETEVVKALPKDVMLNDLLAVQSCVNSLPSKFRLFPPCISYCVQWMKGHGGRRCPKTCKYQHGKMPRGSVAISMGHLGGFAIEDGSKKVANMVLRELTLDLEEQRCFVLDGESGATIRELARPVEAVLSPNMDKDATKALKAKCLSTYSSSFTALAVAKQSQVQFGCVYLDYMWPLNYFQSTQKELKRDLSKQRDTGGTSERVAACEEYARAPLTDGIDDVELLVSDEGRCLLSPTGAVLAVTIVYSKLSTLQMQSRWLERILLDGAKRHKASLDVLGYTKPTGRPVATYFYAWNMKCSPFYLPPLSSLGQSS